MRSETALLAGEPETHVGRHWRECFLCEDYSLTQGELQRLWALREEANVLFEEQPRWDLVRALYVEYFGREPVQRAGGQGEVWGKEWMRLGFQGQYPETDFRGGGVLSLLLIVRFVRGNRALVERMEQDKAGFFFAITAINIAFFLKKYFHLADFLVVGGREYCDRRALKNFCRLLEDREDAYLLMHELFLKYFYLRLWLPAQRSNRETLLQFNALFQRLTALITETFEQNTLGDYNSFEAAWRALAGGEAEV